jgi:hypothetical protein
MKEQRELNGSLFKEDKMNMDYSGSCTIEGKAYWVSGWVKEGASGKKFISLAFKPKESK